MSEHWTTRYDGDVLARGRQHWGHLAMNAERRYQALLRRIDGEPTAAETVELDRLRGLAATYRDNVKALRSRS